MVVSLVPKAYYEAKNVNKVHPSKEAVMSFWTSYIVPRGSPLQENNTLFNTKFQVFTYLPAFQSAFGDVIMWLRDTGILEKLKYDIVRPPLSIPYPKVRRDQPLIMSQLGIVVIVLAAGLSLSLPVFFCELVKGRGKKNLNQKREVRKPLDTEHTRSVTEVAKLTLQYYGRDLEEYL